MLNKFHKTENNPGKRAKALLSFLSEANDLDQRHFFSLHYVAVYRLVLDAMHHLDHISSNHTNVIEDAYDILYILEKLMKKVLVTARPSQLPTKICDSDALKIL